jgi:glycosyltransferase involved in cell wall biosynthesis
VSHRLHMATCAIENGFNVTLVTRVSQHRSLIEESGIKLIDWPINRGSFNFFLDISALLKLFQSIRKLNPDIIHAVAMKPVFFSAIVSLMSGVKIRIYALGGLGYLFSSNRILVKFLRPLIIVFLRLIFNDDRARLILQNKDDKDIFLRKKIISIEKIRMIRGSGVDTNKYSPNKPNNDSIVIILPARMLWDKGVSEFVKCAEQFKANGLSVRFCLIGSPDNYNPESIPEKQLEAWSKSGVIEWWGHQTDMQAVYSIASIVCFPSYREGLPKSLLEAASCSLPIVVFDVPGCREIIQDGVNGFIVPFKDTDRMYSALLKLYKDSNLRHNMGKAGRELVIKEFSEEIVASLTIRVWDEAFD